MLHFSSNIFWFILKTNKTQFWEYSVIIILIRSFVLENCFMFSTNTRTSNFIRGVILVLCKRIKWLKNILLNYWTSLIMFQMLKLFMFQYRPVSADFTKLSGSLSSMFTNDNEKPASNNVLLITCKYLLGKPSIETSWKA